MPITATTPKEAELVNQPTITADIGQRSEAGLDSFLRLHLSRIVVALAVLAGIRVLIFAAAFPLTNNTDEKFHFLTIRMYARGELPAKDLPRMDPGFARRFILYWSPDYAITQEDLDRDGVKGPLYALPAYAQDAALSQPFYAQKLKQWSTALDYEAQAPPMYYVVAAAWYRLGSAFGMKDWSLVYWTRFLNSIVYALIVWFSYRFVQSVYPTRVFLQIAVPALIAVFPQDVFYGMNRDVLSPLICTAALFALIRALDGRTDGRALLLGSFLVGLAFTVEVSNCVLYGTLGAALWFWIRQSAPTPARARVVCCSALASLALPFLWMLRNLLVIGDLTAGKAKMRNFQWTGKPLAEIIHHPLFSWHGLSYFLIETTRSFWQGEYVWHLVPMRFVWADHFYIVSSGLMIVIVAVDLALRRKRLPDLQRWVGLQALFLVGSSLLFLAAISLPIDFHDFQYPSRLYPYFVSGRIVSGVLLPFVLIYVSGLELLANRIQKWISPVAILTCLLLFITVSEIRVRSVVFSSPYNFFALLADRH